jgi:phosphohistidine phosphatase SixA
VPCEALAAAPDLARIAEAVGDVGAEATIALVGHEPWMSELAALLLTGRSDGVHVDYPKSGVMGIEVEALNSENGNGTLRFFLTP